MHFGMSGNAYFKITHLLQSGNKIRSIRKTIFVGNVFFFTCRRITANRNNMPYAGVPIPACDLG